MNTNFLLFKSKLLTLIVAVTVFACPVTSFAQCEWTEYAPWIVPPSTKLYTHQAGANGVYISRCSTAKAVVNFDNSSSYPAATDTNNYNYFGGPAGYICKANAGSTIEVTVWLSYLLSVNGANSNPRVYIWVDWNHNGVFEETPTYTELVTYSSAVNANKANGVVSHNSATQIPTFGFLIPRSAKNGLTRMRIRVGATGSTSLPGSIFGPAGMTACLKAPHGECEEYDLDIVNPCNPPSVVSVSNITCNSAYICWSGIENADIYDYWVDTCKEPGCSSNPALNPPPGTTPGSVYYFGYPLSSSLCRTIPNVSYASVMPETKYYVAIRSTCDSIRKPSAQYWQNSDWVIDSFTTLPCCNNPNNVKVTDIKATTAKASWDPVHTANKYEYAVNTTPNNPPANGTKILGTTVELQGLSHSKTYYFCIRALCNPTPTSDWECAPFATENTTSVSSLNAGVPELKAYPNPVKNTVTITIDNFNTTGILYITDVTGKIVHSLNMNSSTTDIDMTPFAQGLYLIKYASDNGAYVIKITKE